MYEPLATKELPNGRVIHINPLTFGRARLSIGLQGEFSYEDEY